MAGVPAAMNTVPVHSARHTCWGVEIASGCSTLAKRGALEARDYRALRQGFASVRVVARRATPAVGIDTLHPADVPRLVNHLVREQAAQVIAMLLRILQPVNIGLTKDAE